MTLMLNASTLQAVLDMRSTVQAVDRIFGDLARGTAAQPTPSAMAVPSADSSFIVMPSVASEQGLASVKLLADIPSNAQRGLPSQRSLIMLADHITGGPLAILDGKVPTRIRTAAATAVATKYLARPDSTVLGLIGAGALAVAHVEAMLCVLPFTKVVVWSRTGKRIAEFSQAVAGHGLEVVAAPDPEAVVASCDVLCTLTPSVEPIVQGRWFQPGQHINAVGARPRPGEREIDGIGMARSRVFVDHMGTAQAKSGDYLMALAEGAIAADAIAGELGQVVAGELAGRRDRQEITLFNSVGIGALDLAIGRLAYDRAVEQRLGQDVDLSS